MISVIPHGTVEGGSSPRQKSNYVPIQDRSVVYDSEREECQQQ